MTTFIHPAGARQQFTDFVEGRELTNADLARAVLLIALEEYPRLDVDHYVDELDALADRVVWRSNAAEPPVFRLGHLHAEMFDIDGYHGDDVNYFDVKNAYLNDVIDRRAGLPITLSIIFLHVATRIGLNAHGVGLPGHFIVKVQFELNEIYVDPFHGGSTLTLSDIAEMMQGKLNAAHLRAWTARETLVRVLANLQNMHAQAGQPRKAMAARERMDILTRMPS
jgi:regulator of sirC expression with transglutaminase-like and TPR domain